MKVGSRAQQLAMAYEGIGLVFGSLSTTPLYLYSALACQEVRLGEEEYLGLLSSIFWTLTLIAGLKCFLLLLPAHHSTQGGTFGFYSFLYRNLRVLEKQDETFMTQGRILTWIKGNKVLKKFMFLATMFASCMLLGDGIITPSISVLSAVEGVRILFPFISQGVITLISVLVLIGLFLIQKCSIKLRSFMLSPIIITWLATITSIGLYNIILHFPSVYKAISPYYILKLFSINKNKSWLALGASALCLTGVEAIFTDIGYLSTPSIQLGFFLIVYPSTIIAYGGITAYLIKNPEHQHQAFYKFIPIPLVWPMLVLSTLAALVASQGLIVACFSIVKECVELDYFPTVEIIHTSKERERKVYSTHVNHTLMVICIALTIRSQNGNALYSAYGVIMLVAMIAMTLALTMIMLVVWKVCVPMVVAFILFFGVWEIWSLMAILITLPKEGLLPLLFPLILSMLVCAWIHKRALLAHYELSHIPSLTHFTHMIKTLKIGRAPGVCLIHTFAHSPVQEDAIVNSMMLVTNGSDDEYVHDNQGLSSESKGLSGSIEGKELNDGCSRTSNIEEKREGREGVNNKVGTHVAPLLYQYMQTTKSLHEVVVLTCVHMTGGGPKDVSDTARFRFSQLPQNGSSSSLSSGIYVCAVQLGFGETFHSLTEQLIQHLQLFIQHELAALSVDTFAQVEDSLDEVREAGHRHLAELERTRADVDCLTCHMLATPKLKLVTKTNFLQRFIVDKLYSLLHFHDPIIPLLSHVHMENLLMLNMTYEV